MSRPERVCPWRGAIPWVALWALLTGCTESTPARAPTGSAPSDPLPAPSPSAPATAPSTTLSASAAGSSSAVSDPDDDPLERRSFVRFEGQGKFDKVLVVDEGFERHLRFGSAQSVNQSTISLSSPHSVPMEYIRASFLGVLYAAEQRRTLMVGLGGGTFTTLLRRHYPEMWIDVAEIDPMVKKVAIEYFGVKEDERYRIHVTDGAAFVKQAEESYDIALIDAYEGDDIPPQLQDMAFFRSLKAKISSDGVAVLNLSVADELESTLEQRFRAIFPAVACVRTRWGGLVLFGRPTAGLASAEELRRRARKQAKSLQPKPSFDLLQMAMKAKGRCPYQPR